MNYLGHDACPRKGHLRENKQPTKEADTIFSAENETSFEVKMSELKDEAISVLFSEQNEKGVPAARIEKTTFHSAVFHTRMEH